MSKVVLGIIVVASALVIYGMIGNSDLNSAELEANLSSDMVEAGLWPEENGVN